GALAASRTVGDFQRHFRLVFSEGGRQTLSDVLWVGSVEYRATSAAAARSPLALSTVANRSGIASTAMRIPIPSTGRPIARKSGASIRKAPRGTPGATNPRKIVAKAIVA